jgi:hypothetical protein
MKIFFIVERLLSFFGGFGGFEGGIDLILDGGWRGFVLEEI